MAKAKEGGNLIIKLLVSIFIGIVLGLVAPKNLMVAIVSIKYFWVRLSFSQYLS